MLSDHDDGLDMCIDEIRNDVDAWRGQFRTDVGFHVGIHAPDVRISAPPPTNMPPVNDRILNWLYSVLTNVISYPRPSHSFSLNLRFRTGIRRCKPHV